MQQHSKLDVPRFESLLKLRPVAAEVVKITLLENRIGFDPPVGMAQFERKMDSVARLNHDPKVVGPGITETQRMGSDEVVGSFQ